MASTNKTAHYEFPQYIGSDIPNILTDINPAFETIDTALYEQGQQIAEQTTDLSDIQEAVDQATADVAVMQSSIVQMAGIVETTRQLATDNKETIGQGTLDTTAQTLIGAVNELNDNMNENIVAEYTVSGSSTTIGQALTSLYNSISNMDLIKHNAILEYVVPDLGKYTYALYAKTSDTLIFGGCFTTAADGHIESITLASTPVYAGVTIKIGEANTITNRASTTAIDGAKFTIYAN